MRDTLGAWFPLLSLVLPLIALQVYFIRETHKQHLDALNTRKHAIKIQPKKSRFVFSWSIYFLGTSIPFLAVLWLLPVNKGSLTFLTIYLFPLYWAIYSFLSYPQYTLLIEDAKLFGMSLWGWSQKRIEIDIKEIDRQKVMKQNLGRSLGIVVFNSAKGQKILALGLDNLQIEKILDYANINAV